MMDSAKLKKIISLMFLEVITGDVHVRNQYMNTLLTHVSICLKMENLEPNQKAISKFRTRLHNTIVSILHNNYPLPASDATREDEIKKLVAYFDRFVIKIDESVADDAGVEQMGVLEDIESLEYARNICYSASSDYSAAMSGIPSGLTDATNKFAYIINIITPIIYRYGMVEISESDFSNAAKIAQRRVEQSREIKI